MKNVIFLLVFLLLTSINVRAQETLACYPETDCEPLSWSSSTTTIFIPGFETCPITVEFLTRTCGDDTQFSISGIYININDFVNCADLAEYIYPGYPASGSTNWANLHNVWNLVYQQFSYEIFIASTQNDKDSYLCPTNKKTINYFRGTCVAHCFYQDIGPAYTQEFTCSSQSCCKTSREYCYNKVFVGGQWQYFVNETVTVTQEGADCDPNSQPYVNPASICYGHTGPCQDNCSSE